MKIQKNKVCVLNFHSVDIKVCVYVCVSSVLLHASSVLSSTSSDRAKGNWRSTGQKEPNDFLRILNSGAMVLLSTRAECRDSGRCSVSGTRPCLRASLADCPSVLHLDLEFHHFLQALRPCPALLGSSLWLPITLEMKLKLRI